MKFLRTIAVLTFSACLTHCQSSGPSRADQPEWIALFNGIDLTGWDLKIAGYDLNENYLNTFVVEDSILKISYAKYDTFTTQYGHIYYEQPFSHYILRAQYRFVGEQTPGGAPWNVRNSGIMLHSQSAREQEFNQFFPISIEAQFLGGLSDGEPRTTANLCTPGTMVEMDGQLNRTHCISSTSKTYDGDQWVTVDMVVLGDSAVHHIIDMDTVLSYSKPQIDSVFISQDNFGWEAFGIKNADQWKEQHGRSIDNGYIALQAESHPIQFKKVELLNLKGCTDPQAKNYKSYYVKSDPSACQYD